MKRLVAVMVFLTALCTLVSCAKKETGVVIEAYSDRHNTYEAAKLDCPEKLISIDKLNDYMFKLTVGGEEVILSGDNYNGSKPVLYFKNATDEIIYEIDQKGDSKVFTRSSEEIDFTEHSIKNEDIDYETIESIMNMIGMDYEDYYGPLKFESVDSDRYSDIYKTDFDNEELTVYVDMETGLWTKIECDGKTEIKIEDYSLTRSFIPSH